MTEHDAISCFGLPSSREYREAILAAIEDEMIREQDEEGDQALLKCLCIQLFSIGMAEDSLAVWRVKFQNFDLMCGVNIQLLCGAGLQPTRSYLASSHQPPAVDALTYLDECIEAGDFQDWSPPKTIANYRRYYCLDS